MFWLNYYEWILVVSIKLNIWGIFKKIKNTWCFFYKIFHSSPSSSYYIKIMNVKAFYKQIMILTDNEIKINFIFMTNLVKNGALARRIFDINECKYRMF